MAEKGILISAQEKFAQPNAEWVVNIKVDPSWRFLFSVTLAFVTRKKVSITHTYDGNPFVQGNGDKDE